MSKKQELGKWGEKLAIQYLKKAGLNIITTNFFCRYGEIDIIAREQQALIFIEVRLRHQSYYANALESITWAKQKKILKTAEFYLTKHNFTGHCRIDAIGIDASTTPPAISWIKNAIQSN